MTEINRPDVNMPIVGAGGTIINATRRIEIVGTMGAAGTATEKELYSDVQANQIASLFELDSEISDAFFAVRGDSEVAAFNNVTPIDIIPLLEPAGGTACIKTATFSGAATAAGTIEVGVANSRYGYRNIAVPAETSGVATDNEDVAALVATAFSDATKLPVTIAVDGITLSKVNCTYNHKGIQGSDFTLWVKVDVPGITCALAVDTPGVGEPTLTGLYSVNGNTRYTGIAQTGWDEAVLQAHLEERYNTNNRTLDGTGYITRNKTAADAKTELAGIDTNVLNLQYEGIETASWWISDSMWETGLARSAQLAALRALRLTDGADTSKYVATETGLDDASGGIELASLPYMNTPMPWPIMQTGFGYSATEVEEIAALGGIVAGNNDTGSAVVLNDVVTPYKSNPQGDPDDTFHFQNTYDQITEARSYYLINIKKEMRQSRATPGQLVPRRNINNEDSVRDKFLEYFGNCGDLLIAPKGPDSEEFYSKNLSVELNTKTGKYTCSMRHPVLSQTREIDAPIQVAFGING